MKLFTNQIVVVPFDFSESSKRAIDQVLDWADDSTKIHTVFVVEPAIPAVAYDQAVPVPPSFDAENRKRAMEQMATLFDSAKYDRIDIHCEIGNPGASIVALGEKIGADLFVMPSHGRTGLSRLLLGSVAERVLRLAHCPVLILRGEEFQNDQMVDTNATVSGN